MKIVHITQGTVGGTLEYFKLLLPRLVNKDYDITVVCPSYGPMAQELRNLNIKVHCLHMEREISPFKDIKSILNLYSWLKMNKFDIMHLHSSKAGAIGRIANLIIRMPCVYTPHGWSFDMNVSRFKKITYIRIERILSYFTDSIVAISDYEKFNAISCNITKNEKIALITNGIDLNRYINNKNCLTDVKKKLGIPKDRKIIGMVARLAEQKDPLTFIKVARKVSDNIPNAYFILVGDGELRKEVEEQIIFYNMKDNVLITGWVNNVNEWISTFDIGVLTSQWEGFGLVLAEYMASGVPVVATRVGGIPDVILDRETGTLVNCGDVDSFAESIIELLEDNELRNNYVKNGLKRVQYEFNIDRVVKQHEELYYSLLNK